MSKNVTPSAKKVWRVLQDQKKLNEQKKQRPVKPRKSHRQKK